MKKIALLMLIICTNACAVLNVKIKDAEKDPRYVAAEFDPMDRASIRPNVPAQAVDRLNIDRTTRQILINEKQFIDPTTVVDKISPISETGYVTYAALVYDQTTNTSIFDVKVVRPFTKEKEVVLGNLRRNPSYYHFQSKVDGRTYSGSGFFLGSKGILINREDTAISYIDKDEAKSFVVPDGYFVAPQQKGDLSKTRHILILKDLGKAKMFGLETKGVHQYDVSLLNIDTGKITTTIKMKLEGVRESDRLRHLKGTFFFYATEKGNIAISLEDNYQRVVARNVSTNRKIELLKRDLGIGFVKAGIKKNGAVWVKASNGLSDKVVPDVRKLF